MSSEDKIKLLSNVIKYMFETEVYLRVQELLLLSPSKSSVHNSIP
uniref:Uncharacterized protein n=1 Tax=Arundo donax TaxID=35708 RepID=A0A0A8YW47_ARUDO